MNLHDLARGAITRVHRDSPATVLASDGWTRNEAYEQEPRWLPAVRVMAHSQPVNDGELRFGDGERDSTSRRDFYFHGLVKGLERASGLGGALIYWNGFEWQVERVIEDWEDEGWCRVRAVRLRQCPPPPEGETERPDLREGREP